MFCLPDFFSVVVVEREIVEIIWETPSVRDFLHKKKNMSVLLVFILFQFFLFCLMQKRLITMSVICMGHRQSDLPPQPFLVHFPASKRCTTSTLFCSLSHSKQIWFTRLPNDLILHFTHTAPPRRCALFSANARKTRGRLSSM